MSIPRGSFPAQPPVALARSLSDFDQLAAFYSGWSGRFEQLSSGRFDGTLSLARGRAGRIVSVDLNQTVLARGRGAPGLFSLYTVTPANAGGIWQGRRLDPGQFVVHGPDTETNHYTARRCTSTGISAGADFMEEAARSLSGGAAGAWPTTWDALVPAPDAYSRVHNKILQLLARAVADPALLATGEGHQLEQECVRAVVAGVAPVGVARRSALSLAALVRRAEELMRAHLREPLGAIDLCKELRVSDRTLRLAFHERLGLGPMAYYKAVRLNTVRSGLKADPAAAISDVARGYGFHHLGNFAADYRRLFGERPSQTDRARSTERVFTFDPPDGLA
ncbi:helix-turn-helix domain-containing protein [Gemmata sp. G18]|uniref:Helix-turn-helix domain-containing protein n=1 Tax=Gemmata palustris TaxID=2822762 RepID=A0ABS5C1U6_9BACT|nr:helix-turn-helix domain-containing protein [Gemmata palustris]MBP3959946.1 helix-turn-helix domain-containing protein [Gemmata palustris]